MSLWEKKLLAAIACTALLLSLTAPAFGSGSEINLMAVNDRVVETTVENMPRTVGGVLYVPYTMLSTQVNNGINLGVNALYSATRRTVLVTDNQRGVTFDLQKNTAADLNGTPVPARAMVRNTMVFLPIDWLCQYFGTISCTRTRTPYGTLIRVTSSAVILSDQAFVNAADPQLSDNLRRYLESEVQPEGNTPVPSEIVQASDPPSGAELFLAFRPGTMAQECAQILEGRNLRALFLFTQEELASQDGLVRRLAGAGHVLGLTLTGDGADGCLAEAERGRELLAAAAHYNALVVSAPNLDSKGREALEAEGYVLWRTTVHAEEFRTGAALVRRLNNRQVNYVELTCGTQGLSLLRGALTAAQEELCQIYQATAPALSRTS